ncbi:MAG: peptidase MA family metallohydrolase [Myxococcales bacterium]
MTAPLTLSGAPSAARSRRVAFAFAFTFAFSFSSAFAGKPEHAYRLMNEWRIEEAEAEVAQLVKARPHDPDVAFVDAHLKFLHGEYDAAVERFAEAGEKRGGDLGDEIRSMRELAQATASATHGYQSVAGKHFIVAYAPGKDALLASYALDALEKAYTALGADFDDHAAQPVRVEIYPEVADLAKVSTLTMKEIETSGTIALCKFNRLMIVSPRALIAGYPWLDTLTHEYTHFVVSRVSHNTVPIWLHEGLAKFEERRWRGQRSETGGGLTPTMEHLLATGLQRKHLITFEQMHPSMAKLPSQEDTALAFAEVYMVIEYLQETVGWDGIRKIIGGLRDGKNDAQAVAQVVGSSFDQFQSKWRAWLHARKLRARPGLIPTELEFKKGGKETEASKDDSAKISEERARKLARLGGMLRLRHRLRAAATEYEKAQAIVGAGNIQVAGKLARTYLELGDTERAIKAAEPVLELYPDQSGPNATLGEAWLKKGDAQRAQPYLEAALAISPFDPSVHCGLEKTYRKRNDPRADREAEACRALGGN